MPDTTNVLEEMTRGIMGRKQDRATKLTPVGMELVPRVPDAPGSFMAQEGIEAVVRSLRQAAAEATKVADEIERGLGLDPAEHTAQVNTVLAQREAERQADDAHRERTVLTVQVAEEPKFGQGESFPERFTRLSEDAKAATFGDDEVVTTDWKCPDHGTQNIVTLTSRRGRTYRACGLHPTEEFER